MENMITHSTALIVLVITPAFCNKQSATLNYRQSTIPCLETVVFISSLQTFFHSTYFSNLSNNWWWVFYMSPVEHLKSDFQVRKEHGLHFAPIFPNLAILAPLSFIFKPFDFFFELSELLIWKITYNNANKYDPDIPCSTKFCGSLILVIF